MPTILIADDNPDHRELLAIALRRHDYQVRAAMDARTARQVLAAGGVDAIVLDVRMPGESGIELCRWLRAQPGTAALPIMLVSADVCDSRIVTAVEAGADEYLTKPYHRAELIARLESLLIRRGCAPTRAATAAQLASRAASSALAAAGGPEARPAPVRRSA